MGAQSTPFRTHPPKKTTTTATATAATRTTAPTTTSRALYSYRYNPSIKSNQLNSNQINQASHERVLRLPPNSDITVIAIPSRCQLRKSNFVARWLGLRRDLEPWPGKSKNDRVTECILGVLEPHQWFVKTEWAA